MELLVDIILIYALAIIVLLIFGKLKIHTIVGFILTGIIAGPYGIGLVTDVHQVEELAEIGVLLLLFTIGIELSLSKLLQVKNLVFIGGSLQVLLTIIATAGAAYILGSSLNEALFIGFLFALSSTAIVLKILQDQGMIDSLYGKTVLGILIFQDIIIVPMMLITPFLAQDADMDNKDIVQNLGLGLLLIIGIILAARYLMPKIFTLIAKQRSRELFLLFVVVVCFSVAFITNLVGLSLALGAFMAGLIISESEYSHNALGNILPLRDLFVSLFFVSVGMLLDLSFLFENFLIVIAVTLGVAIVKALIVFIVGAVMRLTFRTILLSSLALWQVGEFAFILSITGIEYGLITGFYYQMFLSISILTMALTPLALAVAPGAVEKMTKTKAAKFASRFIGSSKYSAFDETIKQQFQDHIIIIGYGINGKNLAKAAKLANIPYIIIETNPETVHKEREKGEHIFFGDASQSEILNHAQISSARICVVAISDPIATERIVSTAKVLNPKVYTIVRTRYVSEIQTLEKIGADEVIPEEFETSIEIFSIVLQKYLVPKSEIEEYVENIRAERYAMLRTVSADALSFMKLSLSEMEVIKSKIPEGSDLIDKTLADMSFRKKYDATVISIIREGSSIQNPDGMVKLKEKDTLIIFGRPDSLRKVKEDLAKSKTVG